MVIQKYPTLPIQGVEVPFARQARGQFGKQFIFRVRNGVQERLAYYTPTNPQTPAQQAHRQKFAHGVTAWQALPPGEKLFWRDIGNALRNIPGFNAYLSYYLHTH